jgi:hypothetical protein
VSLVVTFHCREAIVVVGDRAYQRAGASGTGLQKVAAIGGVLVGVTGRAAMHDERGALVWSLLDRLRALAPAALRTEDIPDLAAGAVEAVRTRPPATRDDLTPPHERAAHVAVFFPDELLTFKVGDSGASEVLRHSKAIDLPAAPVLLGLVHDVPFAQYLSPGVVTVLRSPPLVRELAARDALRYALDIQRAASLAASPLIGGGVDIFIYDRKTGRIAEGGTTQSRRRPCECASGRLFSECHGAPS